MNALLETFPLQPYAVAVLVVLGAYIVFGLTGFGSTVIAVPLLALMLPLKFVVPLLMLLDLAATLLLGARLRKGIRYDELTWLVPLILVGMALGLTLLIKVDEAALLFGLGLFILLYAAYGFTRRAAPVPLGRIWSVPFGLIGGALSALFGTGGVLFAIYIAGRITDKDQMRATNASTIMLSALVRVVLFGAAGLLTQEHLLLFSALLVPAMIGGIHVGNRLHAAVAASAVVRVVYSVLVVAGVSLLARSAS